MRNFSDKGLETAKERVSELIVRVGGLRPDTDTLTRDDIRGLLCYLRDYHDELISMEYRRNIVRAKRERAARDIDLAREVAFAESMGDM